MKYIRTKNEVYEVEEGIILASMPPQYKLKNSCNGISQDLVIKQADTIEELCDEFVVLKPDKKFLLANNNFDYIKTIWRGNENAKKSDYIYGAIWTDKGLQFVARMNSEGVLELL